MALLTDVGLRDMRVPGVADYFASYAYNDAPLWGRRTSSSQRLRASLAMGKFASSEAWTSANPDNSTIQWASSANKTQAWTRLNFWNHVYLSDIHRHNHLPGWQNNSRVMMWGVEVWAKSKSTGLWTRRIAQDTLTGQWESPDYTVYGGNYDWRGDAYRIETTGYPSVRIEPADASTSGADAGANYFMWHGYTGQVQIDGPDIDGVVSLSKCSLVLHDLSGPDDREYARLMYFVGSDYIGAAPPSYPGVGSGRARFVTAKWPEWEYRVMHTMTESQWNAGGYPPSFVGLTESSGGGGGGGTPPPVASRGKWFAKITSTKNTWSASAVANTAPNKVRRGRRARLG